MLGHFAENQDFHYVVLRRDEIVSENESTMSLNKVESELHEENESNEECGNIFDRMPLEILKKSSFMHKPSPTITFPGHVCCTFQNSVAAIPHFNAFREKAMGFPPDFMSMIMLFSPRISVFQGKSM